MIKVLSEKTLPISELKKDPQKAASSDVVCVMKHNKPVFYCISPKEYEKLLNALDPSAVIG